MSRLGKIGASLAGAIVVISGLGYFGYVVYRDVTVDMALSEAEQFSNKHGPSTSNRSDAAALLSLRPHPWSSPLHDRKFDEAIAGARAAYDAGDYERAIALNNQALEIHPSKDLVWLLLTRRGDCYLQKNDPDKALADFAEAARLGELDSRTYIDRALALRRKGKSAEAMKDFGTAITSNPTDPFVYINRAAILAKDGELDKALADYTKALELNPRNVNARLGCAAIYLRRNESKKAITESTIAMKIDTNWPRSYLVRAKAYAQLRMNSRALADLDAVTKLNPSDKAAAFNNVAWCHATCPQGALRDGKKAVIEATKACELDHWKRWWCVGTLAAAYAEAGDFDQAVKYQKQALQMTPNNSEYIADENLQLQLYEQHKPHRDTE